MNTSLAKATGFIAQLPSAKTISSKTYEKSIELHKMIRSALSEASLSRSLLLLDADTLTQMQKLKRKLDLYLDSDAIEINHKFDVISDVLRDMFASFTKAPVDAAWKEVPLFLQSSRDPNVHKTVFRYKDLEYSGLRKLFVQTYHCPGMNDQSNWELQIKDEVSGMFYVLDDLKDIKPRSLLKIVNRHEKACTVPPTNTIPQNHPSMKVQEWKTQAHGLREQVETVKVDFMNLMQELKEEVEHSKHRFLKNSDYELAYIRRQLEAVRDTTVNNIEKVERDMETFRQSLDLICKDLANKKCRLSEQRMEWLKNAYSVLKQSSAEARQSLEKDSPKWKALWEQELKRIMKEQEDSKIIKSRSDAMIQSSQSLEGAVSKMLKLYELQGPKLPLALPSEEHSIDDIVKDAAGKGREHRETIKMVHTFGKVREFQQRIEQSLK
jgi:hypothetical protein